MTSTATEDAPKDVEADILVIGAGPVGLFSVFACGQLGMSCAVIDALPDLGGQLTALYPEKPIYDIPGRPEVRADQLVADLVAQAAPYAPRYLLGESAATLEEEDGVFELTASSGRRLRGRAVILAAGAGAFGPNKPPLDGIERFEGEGVFYHVAQRERFRDRRVVIAGGGDSAVDWALSLAEIASTVTVVHRRDRFRAAPAMVERMRTNPRIELATGWRLAGLDGAAPRLEAVRIAKVSAEIDGDIRTLPADALIALFGLASDLSPIAGWGVRIEGKAAPVDPASCETSRPGVFAAGDLAEYPGKRRLILTGFAEAAAAAAAAYGRLHDGRRPHFEHSTSRGAPGGSLLNAATQQLTSAVPAL